MGLVFSISNFFINKTYQANNWSAKQIPSCANLALAFAKSWAICKTSIFENGYLCIRLFTILALVIFVSVSLVRENLRWSRENSKHKTRSLEVEWDRQTVKNALRFKRLVETGQFIPNEILQKLEAKANRTPEEEDILKHNIEISNIKEKVRLFSC